MGRRVLHGWVLRSSWAVGAKIDKTQSGSYWRVGRQSHFVAVPVMFKPQYFGFLQLRVPRTYRQRWWGIPGAGQSQQEGRGYPDVFRQLAGSGKIEYYKWGRRELEEVIYPFGNKMCKSITDRGQAIDNDNLNGFEFEVPKPWNEHVHKVKVNPTTSIFFIL